MATEKRLVDANVLIEKEKPMDSITHGMVMAVQSEHILDAPTVDAVEVVRCRECEHYVKLLGEDCRRCSIFSGCYDRPYPTEPEDFCSYGVRKGNAYEK
jgi:hypothetical protein